MKAAMDGLALLALAVCLAVPASGRAVMMAAEMQPVPAQDTAIVPAAPLQSNSGPAPSTPPRFVAVREGVRVVSELGTTAAAAAAAGCPPGSACAAVTPSAPLQGNQASPCQGNQCGPPQLQPQPCGAANGANGVECVKNAVITSAADLSPGVPAIAMPIPPSPIEQHPLETVPGVRVLGQDACGCPKGQDPCLNPCGRERTVEDQLESHLDSLKTQIVRQAKSVQEQNQWVSRVQEIVRHYEQKIARVRADTEHRKDVIRKLFAKKKSYDTLLNKARLDRTALHRVMAAKHQASDRQDEIDIDDFDKKQPHHDSQVVFRR